MSRGGCSCPHCFHDFWRVSKTKRVGRNTKTTVVCLFGPRVTYVFLFFGTFLARNWLGFCCIFFPGREDGLTFIDDLVGEKPSAKQANLWTVWGIA